MKMQETAVQYRQRMFVLVDGKDPVKLQSAAPARLAKLLKGVSPTRARKRPGPDKWSIAEIVVHMADTEVVFGYLIRGIVGEPGTTWAGDDRNGREDVRWTRSQSLSTDRADPRIRLEIGTAC